ncbi:uncharacterized protein LOC134184649 [Corticium candelabrum]|uniref:uncharacterized protein LOC134184649 n=1 Tax=Corticium candelabrum TaxID=121492 RepID=UPI002E37D4AC|nr:uncharacterized protein LOC134184649 [Corticium candelabrum]
MAAAGGGRPTNLSSRKVSVRLYTFQQCRTPEEFFRLSFNKLLNVPPSTLSAVKDDVSKYFTGTGARTSLNEMPESPFQRWCLPRKKKSGASTESELHENLVNFVPAWLLIVKQNMKQLVRTVTGKQQQNVGRLYKTLHMLGGVMTSRDVNDVAKAGHLLVALGRGAIRISSDFRTFLWAWFSHSYGGLHILESLYFTYCDCGLERIPIIDLILSFSQGHLQDFFKNALPAKLASPRTFLSFVHQLLHMASSDQLSMLFCREPEVSKHVLDFALHYSGPTLAISDRIEAITLLAKMWLCLPKQMELSPGATEAVLDTFKMTCRDPRSSEVQIVSHAVLFSLFDAAIQNQISSEFQFTVWDMLVFSMFGNRSFQHVYRFIVASFCECLQKHMDFNVGSIIEQVTRQVKTSGLLMVDIDLFLVLAQHTALDVTQALVLLQLLGQIMSSDVIYGREVSIPFIVLLCRYKQETSVVRFLCDFARSLIESLRVTDDSSVLVSQLTYDDYHKRVLSIEILAKILHLQEEEFEPLVDEVKELLATTDDLHLDVHSLGYFIPVETDGQPAEV